MAFFSEVGYLARTGSVATGAGASYQGIPDYYAAAFQFVAEAVGATPTITFTIEGSVDGNTWNTVEYLPVTSDTATNAAQTVTTPGTTLFFLDDPSGARFYRYWRINVSANTNVTYRCEIYFRTIN